MGVRVDKLIYLYCITKQKPSHFNLEETVVKIYPIYFKGTYAIASSVSQEEFNENNLKRNLANVEWIEKKALQHENVIEHLMEDVAILPLKFPTIFESEENVKKMLRERGIEFKGLIKNLEGREEWGLKIYCDLERFKYLIIEEDESIKKIDREIESCGKGKAFLFRKKRDELIEDIVNKRISEYTKGCFERLAGISAKIKINKLLPKEVTQKKDEMVFNGAFLVNKERLGEFKSVLEQLKITYYGKGLSFDCTGPWPPYNFCDF